MNVFMGYNPLAGKQVKVTTVNVEIDGDSVEPLDPKNGDCILYFADSIAEQEGDYDEVLMYNGTNWTEPSGGGGGDLSTAEVQVTLVGSNLSLYVPFASDGDSACSASGIYQSGTYQVILYKGKAFGEAYGDSDNVSIAATGDAEVGDSVVTITGNCSITLSSN